MAFFSKVQKNILLWSLCACTAMPSFVFAQELQAGVQQISYDRKREFARRFVAKMKEDYRRSEEYLANTIYSAYIDENILPEGEVLMLQPVLPDNLRVDGVILGQVHNGKMLVSLSDFANALGLSIKVDPSAQTASGWYIRENKEFIVDVKNGFARTDKGQFDLGGDVLFEDNDILVPIASLGEWIDFKFEPVISLQELKVVPSQSLPLQERHARRKNRFLSRQEKPPELPERENGYKAAAIPSIDVSTNVEYRKTGEAQQGNRRANANIRTVGDLAYGELTTQSNWDDVEKLRSLRVNYKQESLDRDLLGPMKARRFELGDVATVRSGLGDDINQELGFRVTNVDPLKTFSRPTTVISGYAFPGWDVELYRDTQMISFKEVDENGFYQFDDVDLFASDNNFRLVFFGPQGEVREETLYVPIDQNRLSNDGGAYDVSVTLNDKQAYRKNLYTLEDEGTPSISALYEMPITPTTSVSAGVRSSEQKGERNNVATAGLSTTVKETLINAEVSADDEGEMAAEFVTRRSFGRHDMNNTLSWTGENFDTQNDGDTNPVGVLSNTLRVIGPFPTPSFMPYPLRYNLSSTISEDSEGNGASISTAGISGSYKGVSFNEQLNYLTNDLIADDRVTSVSSLSGRYGRNYLRLQANYEIEPNNELQSVLANYRRNLNKKLELNLEAQKMYMQSLSEFSAKLDWQAGFARISPRVTYNTNKDFFAGISTRFGVLHEPNEGKMRFTDRNVTSTGGISAFVYLDADGDGTFSEGDEPLEGVVVKAPQNGGRATTEEDGIALFTNMRELILTDISLDIDSLKDPSWVPGFEGLSIMPRNGHVAGVEFPVHISGELDGTVYLEGGAHSGDLVDEEAAEYASEDGKLPLRNVSLALYNEQGKVQERVTTDSGGFYYFSRIPPGRYFLIIDEESAQQGNFVRPMPQEIEIGYSGTVIYGRNLTVTAGDGDVPSEILADIEDFRALHPDMDMTQTYDYVLNFGEYNSNLMTSLVWYKMRTRYAPILAGGDLFVPPSQSIPDKKSQKHVLRVGLKNASIDDAYRRCRAMIARDQYCKVEIYPAFMKQASATGIVAVD